MKTIVVCCGSAINTSTIIEMGLKEFLDSKGIEYKIIKCMISELDSVLAGGDVDLVVSNGRLDVENVPVVVGMAYITGFGTEKAEAKILEALNI